MGEEREREGWKVGERVVVSRRFDSGGGAGGREGGWQRWVVTGERAVSFLFLYFFLIFWCWDFFHIYILF